MCGGVFIGVCIGHLHVQCSHKKMPCRLGAVMETAEDIEIDIPKIWDYIGELLCPPVANRTLPLGTLISTTFPSNLLTSGKAALLTTKLLRQCVVVTSEEVVFQLWSSCKEQHDCLQLRPGDLEVVRGGHVCVCMCVCVCVCGAM